jgi:K+-transporting ATPase ATPase C chain
VDVVLTESSLGTKITKMKSVLQALRIYLVLTLLTGIIYPLALTAVAKLCFPRQANGSRVTANGQLLGSDLLAQKFESPRYFWPRPSVSDFATVPSGASNKGPTSADLKNSIQERRAKFGTDVPVDLLTASGSGLDPHISPGAARSQILRVAAARKVSIERISQLVDQTIEPSQLGFLGEPRVNVFRLNRALDQLR